MICIQDMELCIYIMNVPKMPYLHLPHGFEKPSNSKAATAFSEHRFYLRCTQFLQFALLKSQICRAYNASAGSNSTSHKTMDYCCSHDTEFIRVAPIYFFPGHFLVRIIKTKNHIAANGTN